MENAEINKNDTIFIMKNYLDSINEINEQLLI
jgi:hypothetical protein